jgi:hypothetical protein
LVYLTSKCLDVHLQQIWEEFADKKQVPLWDTFFEFLSSKFAAKESINLGPAKLPKHYADTKN